MWEGGERVGGADPTSGMGAASVCCVLLELSIREAPMETHQWKRGVNIAGMLGASQRLAARGLSVQKRHNPEEAQGVG
jgi:hypothetical protein